MYSIKVHKGWSNSGYRHNANNVSKWLNILWPFVPAAIAAHYALHDHHATIFALCYLAVIPAANM